MLERQVMLLRALTVTPEAGMMLHVYLGTE
jgi:hypothetical protein